jgi:hypothetical protein
MEAAERSGVRFNMLVLTMPPYELRVCVHVKATLEKKGRRGTTAPEASVTAARFDYSCATHQRTLRYEVRRTRLPRHFE